MRPRYITATRSAHVSHDREVMRDEQVSQAQTLLQSSQEILVPELESKTSNDDTGSPNTGDATITVTIESQLSGAETYPGHGAEGIGGRGMR